MPVTTDQATPCIGIGLRHAHYEPALSQPSHLDFVEVHTENFSAAGGASLAVLEQARDLYALSLHCTALGPGSALPVPEKNLAKVARLVERFDPDWVSDHLCFGWAMLDSRPVHLGELLPLSRTADTLALVTENIERIQEAIGRPLLIENISSYIRQTRHDYAEPEFLTELARRSGCKLLLDINNLVVNAHNAASDTLYDDVVAWIDDLPPGLVGEIHLAGFSPVPAGEIAIDDHSQPVSALAWQCYEHAIRRFGPIPTLVEWDNALPAWEVLLEQADRAREINVKVLAEAGS